MLWPSNLNPNSQFDWEVIRAKNIENSILIVNLKQPQLCCVTSQGVTDKVFNLSKMFLQC